MDIDRRTLLAGVGALALQGRAEAAGTSLTIGLSALNVSADPHYLENVPADQARMHCYEALVERTGDIKFTPTLATSWRALDDTTWEFKLREGVVFHDGSPFTADDVIATMQRIPRIINSPSSFKTYMGFLTDMQAPDPHTVVFKTAGPFPVIAENLAQIGIISKSVADAKKEDFDSGKAAIGTGPYKYGEFVFGDHYTILRNDRYWGSKQPWEEVTFKTIPLAASRIAALLAGDVDMIERPSLADLGRLEKDPAITVSSCPTFLSIYLPLDQRDGVPPGVSGTDGRNPFRDLRVRQAMHLAVDRQAIVSQVMQGHATVASQIVNVGYPGYNPSIPVPRADPARAKQLLAEAGYPNGFECTLSTSNDRFTNDAQVAQAVAQMLTRVGVRTKVDAMPVSTLLARRLRREFGFYLVGWGDLTGEALFPLRSLYSTRDDKRGIGGNNYFSYSNPAIDAIVEEAAATIDTPKRIALMQQAMKMAVDDVPVLMLHFEEADWAMRKSVRYKARADIFTIAMEAAPA